MCDECNYKDGRNQVGYAVIRHQPSGLVLDASEYQVKLQHYTGFDKQLWKLELESNGRFLIINKYNRHALDIQGGVEKGANLITYEKHGRNNQQWFLNSDGTIVSGSGDLAVHVLSEDEGHFHAGDYIIAYPKDRSDNQHFLLQFQ